MFGQIAKYLIAAVTSPLFKQGVVAVVDFFMRDGNVAAREYAKKEAGEAAAQIPQIVVAGASACAMASTGVGSVPAAIEVGKQCFTVARSLYHAYNAYNGTQFLMGVPQDDKKPRQEVVDVEDGFSLMSP